MPLFLLFMRPAAASLRLESGWLTASVPGPKTQDPSYWLLVASCQLIVKTIHLPISWWSIHNAWVSAINLSASQRLSRFASGSFAETLYGYIYIRAGILVNHEAKLKGVAEASDYTQKPGLQSTYADIPPTNLEMIH